ncbi:MAG: ATP-dependent Clp protease adaptor ClpS [Longimonas sp.]|uniref:ATP-dependent Clp protease adaptor ClpS n=1 Tax=Longimonas sp. TaxID=2039626 RepID=UPI003346D057
MRVSERSILSSAFSFACAAPETATPDVEVIEKEDDGTDTDSPWSVILYNDDVHTFQEVTRQLMKATGCSPSKAESLTWRVHTNGKARVYEGDFQECFEVQSVLKEIDLNTEIQG